MQYTASRCPRSLDRPNSQQVEAEASVRVEVAVWVVAAAVVAFAATVVEEEEVA